MNISIVSLMLELVGWQVGFAGCWIVLIDDGNCYVLSWLESGGVVVVLYIWHSLCNWQGGCHYREHILPVSRVIWGILMLNDVRHILHSKVSASSNYSLE